MEHIIAKIKNLSATYLEEIIDIRRHLHAHPELAYQEFATANTICKHLDEMGIAYQRNIAKTGIVALIQGRNPGKKTIGLRTDMDALQITEKNQVDYISQNHGIMHACGHDAHMASMLGTAKILNQIKDQFEGSVKLIFQPSEEKYPGGALSMISEGVLENPYVEIMIGQHVHPSIDAGKIGVKSGKAMASTDEVYLTVKGKGGHAATPELNIDPIVIASHIIIGLQQIVSRMATPTLPTVLSFGRIIAEGKTNVIPDEVFIEGTLRTVDESWRKKVHEQIIQISQQIAQAFSGSCEVFIDSGYPFLFNDEALTSRLKNYATDYLQKENVIDIDLRMTAEDFAYFSQQRPSCFYRLGVKKPGASEIHNLHTANFCIDENALKTAMGLMAWMAISELIHNE